MLKLILRRVIVAIPTLILVSMIVFMLQKILPGDPVLTLAGEERDPAVQRQHLQEMVAIAADPDKARAHVLNTSMILGLKRASEVI